MGVHYKDNNGGGISINPFIKSDGTLYTFDSDAYIETVPFRSDAAAIAANSGKYLEDLDNPTAGFASNLFKHSTNGGSWLDGYFGGGSVFGVDFDVVDIHQTFGGPADYGTTQPGGEQWPIMAQAQMKLSPIGAFLRAPYYEDARFIYPGEYGADDYIWSDDTVSGENVYSGWYKAMYGRKNVSGIFPDGDYFSSDFLADRNAARWRYLSNNSTTGLNHRGEIWMSETRSSLIRTNPGHASGGHDEWGMEDRGSYMWSPNTRPAYYKSNPNCETIGSELDHFTNTDYVNCTRTPLLIPYPFSNEIGHNNLYGGVGDETISSSIETDRKNRSYDAIFYVEVGGDNSLSISRARRRNNPTLSYGRLSVAWQEARIHQESTGEQTLVWMKTGHHTQGTGLCQPVDLYFDNKAILGASAGIGILSDQSNSAGSTVNQGKFDILGQGTIYNSRQYATLGPDMHVGFYGGLGIIRGGRIFNNIELTFLDSITDVGLQPSPFNEWYEGEWKIKEFFTRRIGYGNGGRWSGRITWVGTTFLNGITPTDSFVSGNREWIYRNCTFTCQYFGGPAYELYDIDQNVIITLPITDGFDSTGFVDSQPCADACSFMQAANTTGIRALVEILPSTNRNFINTLRITKWRFINCTWLINKQNVLALAFISPFQSEGFSSYGSRVGHLSIEGGEVKDWSGAQNGSAFYVATRYTASTVATPFTYHENLGRWTGDTYGWPKYIEAPTGGSVPGYIGGGNNPVGWADGVYGPLKNQSKRTGKFIETDDVLDLTPAIVMDNMWSPVETGYRLAKVELLVEAGGPGNPNINVFVRTPFSTNTTRGGDLTQHTQMTLFVETNNLGQFEILQTDKTITNIKLISYTSNRK